VQKTNPFHTCLIPETRLRSARSWLVVLESSCSFDLEEDGSNVWTYFP